MPKLLNTLRNIVLYVVLAKHDNEQSDLLHRVAEERLLEDLPNYQKVGNFVGANAFIIDFCANWEIMCFEVHSQPCRFWRSSQRRS